MTGPFLGKVFSGEPRRGRAALAHILLRFANASAPPSGVTAPDPLAAQVLAGLGDVAHRHRADLEPQPGAGLDGTRLFTDEAEARTWLTTFLRQA